MPYKKRQSRRPTGYKRKRYATRKPRTKMIANVVKKVLSRNLEKKAWFFASANIGITTAGPATSPSDPAIAPLVSNLIPPLTQGVGHSQRIGNEVKVSKAYIRGYINIREYNATTNPLPVPVYVKMWLVSYKIDNQPPFTNSIVYDSFFDSNNSSINFQSNMLDIVLTPNKDVWTVHASKTIKLGSTNSLVGTSPVAGTSYFDTSPMSAPFYFDCTKHLDKLKYDDTVNNLCTNRNLLLIYQAVNANGQSSRFVPVEVHSSQRVEYTDA